MGRIGAVVALVIGWIAIVFGAMWAVVQLPTLDDCQDQSYAVDHVRDCSLTSGVFNAGVIIATSGIVLSSLGIVLIATAKPVPSHLKFICSQCGAMMTYKTSRDNCFSCGAPINWSMAQMPKK